MSKGLRCLCLNVSMATTIYNRRLPVAIYGINRKYLCTWNSGCLLCYFLLDKTWNITNPWPPTYQQKMNNSTENSENVITRQGPFGYYSLFITLFFLTPAFIFNILLLVAIIAERTLLRTIRFILSNIIIASEVVIFGIAIILIHNVILSGQRHLSSSLFVCRLTYVTLASGAAARLMYMATFAITVYVLVRYGPAKLHFRLSFLTGLILWFFAIILNTALFLTDVLEITFHDGSICAPHGKNVTTPLYAFTYIVVYGLSSFILSVIFSTLSVRHIRKNTISEDTQVLKGMIKFAIFLLVGNSMNLIGISIPILFLHLHQVEMSTTPW